MRSWVWPVASWVVCAGICWADASDVRLNEVYSDAPGTDTLEFIELYGPAGQSLEGLSVLTIEGDTESNVGVVKRAWSLPQDAAIPPDGFFVLGTPATPGVDFDFGSSNRIQNGTVTVLLVFEYTAPSEGDVDADNDGNVDSGISIGMIVDGVAKLDAGSDANVTYFDVPAVGPDPESNYGANIGRRSDGVDADAPADWCFTSRTNAPADPPLTPPPTGDDGHELGTPGLANNLSCPAPPPIALHSTVSAVNDGSAIPITLHANDEMSPGPEPLQYVLLGQITPQSPTPAVFDPTQLGTLIDAESGLPLRGGDVLSGFGNTLLFTPAGGVSGRFILLFKVTDGQTISEPAIVDLFIQDSGRAVITEIMYAPTNTPGSDWEWIEVHNPTPRAINLGTLWDDERDPYDLGNLLGQAIPAGATRIITRGDTSSRTLGEFSNEWMVGTVHLLPLRPGGEFVLDDGGDRLLLFDSDGKLMDQVLYRNGADGWPTADWRASIYLSDAHTPSASGDNDLGSAWHLSIPGAGGAFSTRENVACSPADSDVGSPLVLPLAAPADLQPPVADDQSLDLFTGDSPVRIPLTAVNPTPDIPMEYVVLAGPGACALSTGEAGTLIDAASGLPVELNRPLDGDEVIFTPPMGRGGVFAFAFMAVNGLESNVATVTIDVQNRDRAVITEIMANPVHSSSVGSSTREWEWVEISNFSNETVELGTLWDATTSTTDNLLDTAIAPGQTRIIARIDADVTMTEFLDEWATAGLAESAVIPVPTTHWPSLNQDTDTLYLFDANGELLDKVTYDTGEPWPTAAEGPSLFLLYNRLSSEDNDAAGSWRNSTPGFERAVTSASAQDIGSPGVLPYGQNLPPEAIDTHVGVLMQTPGLVTLQAKDDDLPEGSGLSWIIRSVPGFGVLTDPATDKAILPTDLPYTLSNGGCDVWYTPVAGYTSAPPPGPGDDTFRFSVFDGEFSSGQPYGTATLAVQAGGLLVTEIMYNPQNIEDEDWEWIEVFNVSDRDIILAEITDDDTEPDGRMPVNRVIPAGALRLVVPNTNDSRTLNDLQREWPSMKPEELIVIGDDPADMAWEYLAESDRLLLIDAAGQLLDEVFYTNRPPWPTDNDAGSIFLSTGHFDVLGNDLGNHWRLSEPGVANAYETAVGQDVGSPGLLPGDVTESARLVAAASRRLHGDTAFDLSIPLDGTMLVEPRDGAASIVLTFDRSIEPIDGTTECGEEIVLSGGTCTTVAVSDTTVIVEFDAPRHGLLELTLVGFRSSADQVPIDPLPPIRIATHTGDVNGDSHVNVLDMQAVKLDLFEPVTQDNFVSDCNADGSVNVLDMQTVKLNLFEPVPTP